MAAYYEINKKKVSSPRSKEKKKPSPQSPHPNMDMTNEGEEEVYSVLEKALGLEVQKKPSPPSSRPLLPPPPPSTGIADEGKDVYSVLEQVSRHKDTPGTPLKKSQISTKNTRRLGYKTMGDLVNIVNKGETPKGKSSRGKSSRRKPRRKKSRRGGRRKTQRRRGGRRKTRRGRGKK